jgi:hypothetical protein
LTVIQLYDSKYPRDNNYRLDRLNNIFCIQSLDYPTSQCTRSREVKLAIAPRAGKVAHGFSEFAQRVDPLRKIIRPWRVK